MTQAGLARLAGVSEAAISKAVRGPLKAAKTGRRINAAHAAVRAYLRSHGVEELPDPSSPPAPKKKGKPKPKPKPSSASPAPASAPSRAPAPAAPPKQVAGDRGRIVVHQLDANELADLTLREVGRRFGGVVQFNDYLRSLKQIEDIREKRLRNEESQGALIQREAVRVYVLGVIDASNRRLLNDVPKTLARRLQTLAQAGAPIEDLERTAREVISSQLRPVKKQAAAALRRRKTT